MSISALEDVSAPLRHCKQCGADKPWTATHWKQRHRIRKDGVRVTAGWDPICKTCNLTALRAHGTAKAARKKAGIPETPPVVKALEKAPLPVTPSKPSFRSVLQAAVEPEWPKIARHMAKQAAAGEKNMIKLVSAYVLGVPREASEDDGPNEFWHALLADARQLHAGPDANVGAADADLVPDSDSDG